MIIPVITGAIGIVTQVFKEKCGSHNSKIFNKFTIKTDILGLSYIKHSVLQSET